MSVLDECWVWGGAKDGAGYGIKWFKPNKVVGVHRLAYAWVHGPIPKGMSVMHTCDNPPCCNPNHLRLGTPHENALDMKAKRRGGNNKTSCRQGHPLSESNVYYHTQSGGKRIRKCRDCDKTALAAYRHSHSKDFPPDAEAFVFLATYSALTDRQLGEHYKVSKSTVAGWRREHGLTPLRGRRRAPAQTIEPI